LTANLNFYLNQSLVGSWSPQSGGGRVRRICTLQATDNIAEYITPQTKVNARLEKPIA
jgi:hypothetical protein